MTVVPRLAMPVLALAVAGCAPTSAPEPTPDPFADVADVHPLDLPALDVPAVDGPASVAIRDGVRYTFSLGHCGLLSPVDVDGSFWDAIDGVTAAGGRLDLGTDGEMINATPGVIVVVGDEMRFRTESGSVVRFARHDGPKDFPACL